MSEKVFYTQPYQCSIQDGDRVLESAVQYLSAACIAQWLQQSPSAKATLTLDGDTIDLPVYALRRRNAVVADLPDAPIMA
ncbi:uncharacterized protein BYT42DRAFT_576068 [Radiomyces spectabilis]|uniref:uncharacterized protein n=1 Tax=Radiomyces spectabilis TaxID=64574 RepID=UPI00221F306A|nr:uncharacterized protein BYT42DRAFT_576068 [Radiomyces spectabilis]KAI8374355.1 hypothetical protein BYT42DRAFT_576068 [Radiomyces spectabilis]